MIWDIDNNVCTRVMNCFSAQETVLMVFICNEGNKYQNNTRVSTETVCHKSTYIILFLTQHNKSTNYDKNDNLYTLSPCLTRSTFFLLMMSLSYFLIKQHQSKWLGRSSDYLVTELKGQSDILVISVSIWGCLWCHSTNLFIYSWIPM